MQKPNDLNQSRIVLKQDSTLIAVIEMSLSSWLVAGIVPGVERQPLKKLAVDESALLKLLNRWREEAEKAGRRIERITVAFEAGRDGFWLARWLRARGIEAHVIHASSVAVSREHRRAKTDRLDTELLKRAFLGWLRGERDHCKMVAIPTTKDEDAKRPNRERQSLVGEQTRIVNRMKAALIRLGIRGFNPKLKKAAGRLEDLRTPEGEPIPPNTLAELRRDMERRRLVSDQIRQIEEARLERMEQAPGDGPHAMVRLNKETGMKEVESGVKYMLDFKSPIQGLLDVHSRYGLHTWRCHQFVTRIPRLQLFRHLHSCSGCFRLERLPGGTCTHWKAPPCHGAHPTRTLAPAPFMDVAHRACWDCRNSIDSRHDPT